MKINAVYINNIEKLYNAIAMGKTSPTLKKEIGRNITQLYNHISISFDLSGVNILESMFLKQICGDHLIPYYTTGETEAIDDKLYPEMRNACNKLMNLVDIIESDSDIEIPPGMEMFPAICIQKRLMVEFTGPNCGFLLGSQPDIFFKNVFHFQSNDDFILPMPDKKKDLEEKLSELFYNSFYKAIYDKFTYMDLLVDGTIKSEYYDYIGEEETLLSHVITPYGDVHFIGDASERIELDLEECKKIFTDVPLNFHDESFKQTTLFYEVKTSLYVFLEMFLALPSSFFSDHLDFKIILSEFSDFVIPRIEKYGIRIEKHFSRIIEEKQKIIENSEQKLEKYFFMLLNTKIVFTLKLSLDNISSDLCLYEKRIIEKDFYGSDDSYLKLEILKIIEQIKNSSKIVYRFLTE